MGRVRMERSFAARGSLKDWGRFSILEARSDCFLLL